MKSRKWTQDRGMTKEQLKEFGAFLKEARQSLGYNTTQMSELLYVHRTSYSRWERSMHVPQADAYLIRQEVEQVLTYSKQHKKAA